MLTVSKNGEIELTRGDTATLSVDIVFEKDKQPYVMESGDTLTLSIKKDVKDPKPRLQKTSVGENTIYFEPKDTANLDFGKYIYDVELLTQKGEIYTIIGKTVFTLLEEVTTR